MVAGLTLFNDSGTVQIDQNWRNYGFRQKIPVTITAYVTSPPNPLGFNGNTFQLVLSGTAALLVACKASTLLPIKLHSYYDSGTWTFNWLFIAPGGVAATETVEFFVFDTMNGAYSQVGLEVWIDGGPRVFHSDAPVMKVGAVQGCDAPFTGAGGKSYVPLILRNPIFGQLFGGGYRVWSHCLRVAGPSIVTDTRPLSASFGASGGYANAGAFAAIDVTGF